MLKRGIYEQVINRELDRYISSAEAGQMYQIETEIIDPAEAAVVLAQYVAVRVSQKLRMISDSGGHVSEQMELANRLLEKLYEGTGTAEGEDRGGSGLIAERGELLLAVTERLNHVAALGDYTAVRPVTSVARSSLFTGAVREPSMYMEIKKEISSADGIDMLVSFVKWSGLRLIYEDLQKFTEGGGRLRVITTSYMGATDAKAVEMLRKLLNTEVKVSYNTARTRLHAKVYVFFRESGFTTAYIGSSNMTRAALSTGLEWNVKVAGQDLPDTLHKVTATFEGYWHDGEFETYNEADRDRLRQALQEEKKADPDQDRYFFDIRPYDYQVEILDKLRAERAIRGHDKNLVVAATGTGKTVIAAFDYRDFCCANPGRPNRLLFIAHREEILTQSIACFRGILHDANFGDLFVGGCEPRQLDHLFMSIQTFNARDFASLTSHDFYDYIVVDEFHHAAAPSYSRLLGHYTPQIMLGLTATPERLDGKSILEWFDNRIAAEIRLPAAIDRKLLCPFQYFGVSDSVDLSNLRWSKGGYDRGELEKVYTADTKRAGMVMESLRKYVTDLDEVKGLGFCVSMAHARFMAEFFNSHDIPSQAVTADSPDSVRWDVKEKLVKGEITFIFVVDLYNEGVDIPAVNTILFLRPTESLTVFLQQLGRGLRLFRDKECLTVLDFIGQAHAKYDFAGKFAALLTNVQRGIRREIEDGFLHVPRGSYIHLERMAKDYVLNNIRQALRGATGLVANMASFKEDTGLDYTYANFVNHYRIDLRAVYPRYSFARLAVRAGLREDFREPGEELLTKALARLCHINSRRWISFLLNVLPRLPDMDEEVLTPEERTMLLMLHYTIYQQPVDQAGFGSVLQSLAALHASPTMLGELMDLLRFAFEGIDFIDRPVELGLGRTLDLHCSYTRDQVLTGLGYYTEHRMPDVREGVKYLEGIKLDIFFITLNKSDKDYSPTTLYEDYSISDTRFHWQSQSTTSEQSQTGQRYIHHQSRGGKVALFVREDKKDKAGACPYTFLGLADYESHTGSKPMNIIWRLHEPIPAKFLQKTNKLIVG